MFESKTGFTWSLAKNPLVTTLQIAWENGVIQKLNHLERPQLGFKNGKPAILFMAADDDDIKQSFNVHVLLQKNLISILK